jgi:hypothetical protein
MRPGLGRPALPLADVFCAQFEVGPSDGCRSLDLQLAGIGVRYSADQRRVRPGRLRRRIAVSSPRLGRRAQVSESEVSGRAFRIVTVAATVVAAVAAIGGMWAQAVTTYWSQQTAKDQLEQSKEESDQKRRTQASQVTLWIEKTKDGPRPHIANRSPDAVTAVTLSHPTGLGLLLPDLPPCTQVVYTPKPYRSDGEMHAPPSVLTEWTLYNTRAATPSPALLFTDRHGHSW